VKGGKWEETIPSIVVCLLTCNLCVVVVMPKLLLISKEQAASSSHRGTSTPLAPQRPLFLRISPFAEIFKKEDQFFACSMGHWTKRRLKEGDYSRFGDQHFILLLYHSMKCGSYLSTLLSLHHSPHTLFGVVVHVVSRVVDKMRKLCWMPLCLVGEGEMISLPTSSSKVVKGLLCAHAHGRVV
jgi:hypothetical protein